MNTLVFTNQQNEHRATVTALNKQVSRFETVDCIVMAQPEHVHVLEKWGILSCTYGDGTPLFEACARYGVDVNVVLTELNGQVE